VRYVQYKNPGDFIIDAIGLDPESDQVQEKAENEAERESSLLADLYIASPAFSASVHHLKLDLEVASSARTQPDSQTAGQFATSFSRQLWVLYARRHRRSMTYPSIVVFEWIQAGALTVIIALALSYNRQGRVDSPFRNLLFLFMMSYYAMVVQYLVLVPLYFAERQILLRERLSGVTRFGAYILSSYLNEMPTAIFYACVLVPIGYSMMDLNDNGWYPYMLVVCMIVGVGAWQSNVTLCCCLTDQEEQVYSMVFLILGAGLLFGGLAIGYSYIPLPFMWAYYVSIPSTCYRAILINDFVGDQLHAPCSDVYGAALNTSLCAKGSSTVSFQISVALRHKSQCFFAPLNGYRNAAGILLNGDRHGAGTLHQRGWK
jgi:hypothetical protein